MLPGQPVSLLGPRGDEHGPGVGVDTLGQHLLGQESEGNHQSPEQEQRAGPQIHQSIGVPLAGEQEGPGSGGSSGRLASAPRGAPASPLSPREHGDQPAAAGTGRPEQQHDLQRDPRVRPRGAFLQTQSAQAPPGQATAPAPGRDPGTWHHFPPQLTNGHARPWTPRSGYKGWPSAELLFTFPIAQCMLMLCAYKQGDSGRDKGTKGGRRHGQGSSTVDRSPFSNREGTTGAQGWEQPGQDAGLSSPKGTPEMSPDAARGTPANWEAGSRKTREPRAPAPPQPASRRCLVAVPSTVLPVTVSSSALPFLRSTTW